MKPVLTDPIMEYPPDLVNVMRKKHNLDQPGRMEDALNILEEWIQKQDHFTKKKFDRFYLETCLITCKGLIERAKSRLDRCCSLRTMMPEFFGDYNPKQLSLDKIASATLPKIDVDNNYSRIYIVKNLGKEFTSEAYKNYYRYKIITSEYMRSHDYIDRYVIIFDFTEINLMDLITTVNLTETTNMLTLLMQGYGMSVQGIHIVAKLSASSTVLEALLKVIKNIVLNDKLRERIHIHTSYETLHKHITKEILPVEYGGKEISLLELSDKWQQVLSSDEHMNYMREINQAKVNECLRQDKDQFSEDYLPGSFRHLNVD